MADSNWWSIYLALAATDNSGRMVERNRSLEVLQMFVERRERGGYWLLIFVEVSGVEGRWIYKWYTLKCWVAEIVLSVLRSFIHHPFLTFFVFDIAPVCLWLIRIVGVEYTVVFCSISFVLD